MPTTPSIVITGASTGIGYAIAERFLAEGWRVFAGVRSDTDMERLGAIGAIPLKMDVTDGAQVAQAAQVMRQTLHGAKLAGLVNNAGIAVGGPLLYVPMEQIEKQIDINLLGPARVTQAFAPLLGVDRSLTGAPGRIVQISSVAGKFGMPFMGPYVASKFGLEGMSESLRRELILFGIAVSVVAPGPVITPIWEKAQKTDETPFLGTEYEVPLRKFTQQSMEQGRKGLPPERVADAVWHAMTARRPKLRYAVVPSTLQQQILPRLIPARLMDSILTGVLGLRRR